MSPQKNHENGLQHRNLNDIQSKKPSHWRELHDPSTGRLLACRPTGGPAGCFPITPYWHCMFHDPYERINFWSHAVPGVILLVLGIAASLGLCPGGAALAVFGACSAVTHLLSAITHVYPDDHVLEKCDHLGIVVTIIGTPLTAMMAKEHGHVPLPLMGVTVFLLLAAFMKPLLRVVLFISGGAVLVALYGPQLLDELFIIELVLYVSGGLFFLRNDGHKRGVGLSDHHMLHYFVTVASALHVVYLLRLLQL